ncbi:DUF3574 domain-containing protein [Calothrix sp. UHCC 0171]|uniref:DUF3574 domain-containing protein n=1 Tax=Calothrix sp. UHCC 0171 TaxID=3110245 RepID=UPI002B205432|nr:DUF3574 domain-containing protein [Calothrix sp. UHCC 0171]MEA5570032.1 DUF3574 domain-containing protein [Calothrix sp. UHCC 0171]
MTPVDIKRLVQAQSSSTSNASGQEDIIVKEELYFGLSKPEGKVVSELEWQRFLNNVISPRFREGFTVMNANGQYLSRNGKLIRENTKLVILIHQKHSTKNVQVQEAIAKYKQMFQQESVLRVTSNVKLSF